MLVNHTRPTEFLDFTSLTLDEFHELVPPFETAFQAYMAICATPSARYTRGPRRCHLRRAPPSARRDDAARRPHRTESTPPPGCGRCRTTVQYVWRGFRVWCRWVLSRRCAAVGCSYCPRCR